MVQVSSLLYLQYPHKVNKDKMLYDCGILLNEDGEFGRPDYRDHDSGLSLHSFYLVTWSTIGTLCMSLLTNPQAQEAVHGMLCCVPVGETSPS